jgi:cellulose synthase/poly-beta-1,6-N-acetylglucosamine synthase-like glycosyltransferase
MFTLLYATLAGVIFVVTGWSLYNLPILVAGVKSLLTSRREPKRKPVRTLVRPSFSIVVPVRDEERVVGRLLNALVGLDYPADKREIIVVEDGSTDNTLNICLEFAKKHDSMVKVLHKPFSDGKPSALNYGIQRASGDIIAIFDGDSVPASDALLNVLPYFEDQKVAAVQGRTMSVNSEENMLTKFMSYEEAAWCEAYLRGKDALNLFVSLMGSCQFIRRDVLEAVGGFDERYLAEDMELSANLTNHGYRTKYAPDVRALQESPSELKQLLRQRTRWFRGWMQVALRYGGLMAKPSRAKVDAEATLLGPFILIGSLAGYVCAFLAFFAPAPMDSLWRCIMQSSAVSTLLAAILGGIALIWLSKPKRLSNLLWLPFLYGYCCMQAFIALYAVGLILLRRPAKWLKTEKKGSVSQSKLNL